MVLGPYPGYHVTLTDGTSTIGLKLCNERGEVTPKAIEVDNNPRTAMQISQNSGGYGDFEMPFTPIQIDTWAGGRGNEDHERDTGRYADSYQVDTTTGEIVLAPWPTLVELGLPDGGVIFFHYRGALMMVTQPANMSGSRVFLNGYYGAVKSNNADRTKLDTSLNLTGVNLAGKTVRLTTYPGNQEEYPYRTIVSNTSGQAGGDTLTVTQSWKVDHSTATHFVIEGLTTWVEIPQEGWLFGVTEKDSVTSVAVVGDIIYFARGDNLRIVKMTFASGAYSWAADGDATKAGKFLALVPGTDGIRRVWRINATTGKIYRADVVTDFATALTWTDSNGGRAIKPGSTVTNLLAYNDPTMPFILLDDGIGSINEDVFAEIPLGELFAVKDLRNGRAACVNGVYLFFSHRNGLMRYYDRHLDSVGPNLGEGLPAALGPFDGNRQGRISAMASFPGRVYVTVNAAENCQYSYDGVHPPLGVPEPESSVLVYIDGAWHEMYRNKDGGQIRAIAVQPLEGNAIDRLWVSDGADLQVMDLSINPRKEVGYRFAESGTLTTARIYGRFPDVSKYWHSLKLYFELPTGCTLSASYQVDGGGWNSLPASFTTPPVQEVLLSSSYNVAGKYLEMRFALGSNGLTGNLSTPRIKRAVVECVTRLPVKRSWNMTFLLEDFYSPDLTYQDQGTRMQAMLAKLEEWANVSTRGTPILMSSIYSPWVSKRVFIEPPKVRPLEVRGLDAALGTGETSEVRMLGHFSASEV